MNESVTLRLPTGWIELDPRVEDLPAEARRAIRALIGEQVDFAVLDEVCAPMIADLRRLAAMTEALLCGAYVDIVELPDADPLVLTASVVLALTPPADGLAAVRRELAGSATTAEVLGVRLAAGDAVLATGRETLRRPEWTDALPLAFHRYFLPVDGSDRLLALAFATPNIELADEFASVFRAIADTLRLETVAT